MAIKTKIKRMPAPLYCSYSRFINSFPDGFRPSLTAILMRSKRGTFPAFIRLENKASPALFLSSEILSYTEKTFGDAFPSAVADVAKALGLPKPRRKKAGAKGPFRDSRRQNFSATLALCISAERQSDRAPVKWR
jgi:hypothetical protein